MARTQYINKRVSAERRAVMDTANAICTEYAAQGLTLTLRQLYYQFVARGLVPNEQKEYDRLGDACRDARMMGIMDWDHLIDRTRNLSSWKTYPGPQEALAELAGEYHRDLWAPQRKRVEVWVEKDAAIGVVEGICAETSVPYFSCRGYTSVSEMHAAAQRIRWHIEEGNEVTILHVGDHDPSGLDMSRDIEDRLWQFLNVDWGGLHMGQRGGWSRGSLRASMQEHMLRQMSKEEIKSIGPSASPFTVKRVALNLNQIEQYNPPPNPAKQTDARYRAYVEETGLDESWELDALEPTVLQRIILDEIEAIRNTSVWAAEDLKMERERQILTGAGNWWDDVSALVEKKGEK